MKAGKKIVSFRTRDGEKISFLTGESFKKRMERKMRVKQKKKEKNKRIINIFARMFICVLLVTLIFMIGFRVGQFDGYRTAVNDLTYYIVTLLDGNHATINIQLNETILAQEAYKLVQARLT